MKRSSDVRWTFARWTVVFQTVGGDLFLWAIHYRWRATERGGLGPWILWITFILTCWVSTSHRSPPGGVKTLADFWILTAAERSRKQEIGGADFCFLFWPFRSTVFSKTSEFCPPPSRLYARYLRHRQRSVIQNSGTPGDLSHETSTWCLIKLGVLLLPHPWCSCYAHCKLLACFSLHWE